MNYSHEESLKIIQLMSDLVFCQRKISVSYLFTNIGKHIELLKNNSKNEKNFNNRKEKYLNSVNRDYEIIIKDYEYKKPYLIYFSN